MQTLGLQGESKRSDGRLKSIFWPTVENAWDVDYLGQQGFWLCFLVAVAQLAFSLLTRNLVFIATGAIAGLVYWLGGMGVREKSWPAAAIIFVCYLFDTTSTLATGMFFTPGGLIRIAFLGLLLSNLRATFLASEWRQLAENEDQPMRFSETLRDKLVDVWPAKLWPPLKIPFFVLSSLWLFLSLAGLVFTALFRLGVLHPPRVH
jgi:hypothetical protein